MDEETGEGIVAKYKVTTRKKLTIHRIADCFDCDWSASDYKDYRMAEKCRKHVAETGHTVGYETGTSTVYSRGGIA